MTVRRLAALAGFALAACSGSGSHGLVPVRTAEGLVRVPGASKVVLAPTSLAILSLGAAGAQTVKVSETGFTGTFTEKSTCAKIATASPASGKGPALSVKITGAGVGSCSIVFSDSNVPANAATLPITVTTAAFKLTSASISAGSKSIQIQLTKVNGKVPAKTIVTTVKEALPKCTASCTVAGPQAPAGSDTFVLTTYDGANATGNKLATQTLTATILAGKANLPSAALGKIPKFLIWGSVPSATAGTAFGSPVTLALIVQDADHNGIAGTYATPIALSDSDTSLTTQGSSFVVNGAAGSHTGSLTKSSDTLKLDYKGLAIAATLSAQTTGVAAQTADFDPVLAAIQYSGPTVASSPEIDLYSTTQNAAGYSATFTDTQAGWRDGNFTFNFTYAMGGTNNNCSSFNVTPNSGTDNSYTVNAQPSAVVGTCTLTVTGGAGASSNVLLTYTTTGIGIGLRRAKP